MWIPIYLAPDIGHQALIRQHTFCFRKLVTTTHIPILEELELFRALYFRLATLGLGQQVHQTILDGLGHALGVSADVNIRPLFQYKRRERSPVVPDQILDVHLACLISHIYGLNPCPLTAIGLAVLSGERHMHVEFTLEFGGVFRPFILVQEVLVALPASVEEVDRSPIVQRIRPRLFDSSSCEGDPFLNEASERRDALQRQTGSKRTRSGLTVPGPIMITGTFGEVGSLNVDRRT